MAEVGARPKVSPGRRKALGAMRSLFTPLLPDDYLELINPLWSTQELRGRVERLERQTEDAVTIVIKPGADWDRHQPGQYLRVGVIVDGVHHWRAYSITSEPSDDFICITPKLVKEGKVSPHLTTKLRPGTIVRLGGVEGDFTLPDPRPDKALFISAGSGVTPIMSMLRALEQDDKLDDAVLVHSARHANDVIFCDFLLGLDERSEGFRLHLQLTEEQGRISPPDLERICPDWRERETFLSGPSDMLDAMEDYWEREGDRDRLRMERFQPKVGFTEEGEGGEISFLASDTKTEADGGTPILVAGEECGLDLAYGCREGICHTCTGKLCSGRVRDLRNGNVYGTEGETIRVCISAPEGPVEVDL
jgi:stearoyl-CoA 9-desaturase NADPH oxidoreductase